VVLPSDKGTIYGPKIGRILTKGGWSRKPERVPLVWAKAVALGLERDVAHIPVLRAVVGAVLRCTTNVDATPYLERDSNSFRPHVVNPGHAIQETYNFLVDKYGVDATQVNTCESILSKIEQLPALVSHHCFTPFFDEDIKSRTSTDTSDHIPPPREPKVMFIPGAMPIPSKRYVVLHTLLAPFWEEAICHIPYVGRLLKIALILFEACCHIKSAMDRDGTPQTAMRYIPTAVLHLVWAWSPLPHAIIGHFLWNLWSLFGYGGYCWTAGSLISLLSNFMTEATDASSRVPRRAQKYLQTMLQNRQITPDGCNWLIAATDPFHDTKIRCPGYPDLNTVSTVVQEYQTSFSVGPTSNVTSGSPWDAHIFVLPVTPLLRPDTSDTVDTNCITGKTVTPLNQMVNDNDQMNLYPGLNAICVNSGVDWLASTPTSNNANYSLGRIPNKYHSGHSRLIACGVEVKNTTPELYRGGSVTNYRVPSSPTQCQYSVATTTSTSTTSSTRTTGAADASTTVYITGNTQTIALPPTLASEATLYNDTRVWGAEDGTYFVCTQCDTENPFIKAVPGDVLVKKVYDSSTVAAQIDANTSLNSWGSMPTNFIAQQPGGACCNVYPFDISGVIFTGLNYFSTLQVTTKYFFERIPATSEPDVLGFAQTAPAYDGTALELYSRAMACMPVAVPVNENPLGEWFSGLIEGFLELGPKVGRVLQNVGVALGAPSNTPMVSKPNPKTKAQPPPTHNGNNKKKPRKRGKAKGKGQFTLSNKQ